MIWYVALGGAAGSAARYLLALFVQQRVGTSFPVGTLLVNITGSFLLGFLIRYSLATPAISAETRALLTTGFCGGYTTFSTFSYETMMLFEEGAHGRALGYVLASLLLSLAGTVAGFGVARELLALRRAV